MENSIMVIEPYYKCGTWVFDDKDTELVAEPFVCGIPQIIDALVQHIPNAHKGFRLLFSTQRFPEATRLKWVKEEAGGNWYDVPSLNKIGWLCPALFKYFATAPKELFCKAEAIKK